MHMRALIVALSATGMLAPGLARADLDNLKDELPNLKPKNNCAMMAFYGGTQVCRWLSNGLTQCQPVGMMGPSPDCPNAGQQPLIPVPLAPPVIQGSPMAANPYAQAAPMPVGQPFFLPLNPAQMPAQNPFPAPQTATAQQPAIAPWPWAQATQPGAAMAGSAGTYNPSAQPAFPWPSVFPAPQAPAPAAPKLAAAPAQPGLVPAAPPAAVLPPAALPAPVPAALPPVAAVPAPSTPAPSTPEPATPAPSGPVASAPTEPTAAPPAAAASSLTLIAGPAAEDALAHFDFDSAKLTNRGRARIDAWLAQYPNDIPVMVTGHTDRLGPRRYNLKLSKRRAEAVRQYLQEKGVAAKNIEVQAKGESEPVKFCKGGATAATKACLAPNRRVVIALD